MSTLLPHNGKIQLAVVTGGHTFQVPPFYEVFRQMSDVDFYPQSLDDFTADEKLAAQYDVVLFYHMHQIAQDAALPWYQSKLFSTLEQLGNTEQGILVLHHSLVAFPEWPLWTELVGVENRGDIATHYDQLLTLEVVDPGHTILEGISEWTLPDESYEMASPREEDGNHLLLTTSHPKSMSGIAWTRAFRKSRVFCCQSGHDVQTFEDEGFRKLIGNAIRWLAKRGE